MIVSSEAVSGLITSTSFIIGAGLKKWIPHTLSGRSVVIASSTTASVEVLVAMIASGLTMRSRCSNRSRLAAMSSTMLSMTRSQSFRSCRSSVTEILAEDRVALVLGQALAGHLLGEACIEAVQHGVGACLGARAHDDVEAGSGGHFGEPGTHDPGSDDSYGADRSHTRKLATGR